MSSDISLNILMASHNLFAFIFASTDTHIILKKNIWFLDFSVHVPILCLVSHSVTFVCGHVTLSAVQFLYCLHVVLVLPQDCGPVCRCVDPWLTQSQNWKCRVKLKLYSRLCTIWKRKKRQKNNSVCCGSHLGQQWPKMFTVQKVGKKQN